MRVSVLLGVALLACVGTRARAEQSHPAPPSPSSESDDPVFEPLLPDDTPPPADAAAGESTGPPDEPAPAIPPPQAEQNPAGSDDPWTLDDNVGHADRDDDQAHPETEPRRRHLRESRSRSRRSGNPEDDEGADEDRSPRGRFLRKALVWTPGRGARNARGSAVDLTWLADQVEDRRFDRVASEHARNRSIRTVSNWLLALNLGASCCCLPLTGCCLGTLLGGGTSYGTSSSEGGGGTGGAICCSFSCLGLLTALASTAGYLAVYAVFPTSVPPSKTRRAVHVYNSRLARKVGANPADFQDKYFPMTDMEDDED